MTETTRDTHLTQVEALRGSSSHSIKVLTRDGSYLASNCVMYAFGLEQDARYMRLARQCLELDPNDNPDLKYQGVHPDTRFVEFLIAGRVIVEVDSGKNGDIAIYYSGDRVKHIGRIIAPSRVLSKWGTGHLFAHAINEAPSNYGCTMRFFTSLSPEQTLCAFTAYAVSKGIPLETSP